MKGITLDAGALIALDRNDRRVIILLARAAELRARHRARDRARPGHPGPSKQARRARLIRQPSTRLVPVDGPDATQVGLLLAASGTADVVNAHVVICARRHGESIVTSDPDDFGALDPEAMLVALARPTRSRTSLECRGVSSELLA